MKRSYQAKPKVWVVLNKAPFYLIKQAEYEEGSQINEVLAESLNIWNHKSLLSNFLST